jgi:hypothetical protein
MTNNNELDDLNLVTNKTRDHLNQRQVTDYELFLAHHCGERRKHRSQSGSRMYVGGYRWGIYSLCQSGQQRMEGPVTTSRRYLT